MQSEFYTLPDELLIKHLLEETNAEERLQVEKWLAQKEEHRAYFSRLRFLLEKSGGLIIPNVDEEAAWQRFRQRIREPKKETVELPEVKKSRSYLWMKVAAVFLIILASSALLVNVFNDKPAEIALSSRDRVVADTLPDGSFVTLNKGSRVSYSEKFTGKTREVALEGEAFFSVKADRKKPFLIRVRDITVKVVGTSFNIRSSGDSTEVIVETGVVQVSKGGRTIELRPKETVVIHSMDSVLEKEKVEEQLYNYYYSRQFVCDHTPLWKLVDVLNQAYGANIRIEGERLKSLPITVTFNNESLDQVLQVISTTFEITVEKKGEMIILR